MSVLSAIALALIFCALAGLLTGRAPRHLVWALDALGNGLNGIQSIREGSWFWSLIDGALCAVFAWWWWHGGGGDSTRRRLRRLQRRFQGVRRTAPTTA